MRTRFVHLLMAIVPIVLMASCDRPQPEPDLPPLTAAEITADLLWERLTIESDYGDYNFWPGHEGENPGQSPHGPVHRIYANKTLLEALPIANRIAPNGSLIVKDNLNAARELDVITVMAKIEGFDPEHGDWYWASFEPDGTVRAAGALPTCVACHAGVSANDYVIVRRLDETLE